MHKITDHLPGRNEEGTFAQANGTLSEGLLRKEHEIAPGPAKAWRDRARPFELGRIGYGKQTVNTKSQSVN